MLALLDEARARGASVLIGGEPVGGRGYFYEPTVLRACLPDARIREGGDLRADRADLHLPDGAGGDRGCQRTQYGLVAYLYTRDLDRAFRVAEGIEAGMVGINQGVVSNPAAPFGGVKQSGSAARAASRGSASTSRRSTSRSRSPPTRTLRARRARSCFVAGAL